MSYQPGQHPTVLGIDPYLELNNQGKTLHLKLHKPQVVPVKPGKHEQLYEHVGSLMLQSPPFKHGDEIH